MSRHTAPATKTVPSKMWAAISEDNPPLIYEVAFHKKNLDRTDLRHIQVAVTPILRRDAKKRRSR